MTNETTLDILTAARDRIASGWCQRHSALDADGKPAFPSSAKAVKFCVIGALAASHVLYLDESVIKPLRESAGIPKDKSLFHWNDQPGRTQAEVLEAFDRAIVKANAVSS
jgi:hypothetical protein